MNMPKKLVVGNWKLYPTLSDSLVLAASFKRSLEDIQGVDVAIAPPASWLVSIAREWKHQLPHLRLAAQNIHAEDQGAFTGEISAYLLKDIISYAIIGHSERRSMGEKSEAVSQKAQACLKWGITPIVCVGETKKIMSDDGSTDSAEWARLREELKESVKAVTKAKLTETVIAYEPVWAISSHHPASAADPSYAQAMIAKLRLELADQFGNQIASQIRFLYGGSVASANAADYLRLGEVGGLLVGHESVKAKDFTAICRSAARAG